VTHLLSNLVPLFLSDLIPFSRYLRSQSRCVYAEAKNQRQAITLIVILAGLDQAGSSSASEHPVASTASNSNHLRLGHLAPCALFRTDAATSSPGSDYFGGEQSLVLATLHPTTGAGGSAWLGLGLGFRRRIAVGVAAGAAVGLVELVARDS
jgi:hypothetical protein